MEETVKNTLRRATQIIKEEAVESEDCETPHMKIKVEAQPNEEATGSSSTPLSQSGQNKDDDWLGDVFIVKEEKGNPDDKLDSEIETFCNTTNITREEDSLKWSAERESLFPCLRNIWQFHLQV